MKQIKQKLKQKSEKIKFNQKEHKYFHGINEFISVTTLIKQFYPSFDPTGEITARCALRAGITPREQTNLWEEQSNIAKENGIFIHELAQQILEGTYTSPKAIKPEITAKIRLLHALCEELKPSLVACEQVIANKEYMIAGTIDLITIQGDELQLWDWKTNQKDILIDKYWEMMLEPLQYVPANDYYKYALQLSLYRYLLELDGHKVGPLRLLHIKEKKIDIIDIPYMEKEVEMILNERKKQMQTQLCIR